MGAANARWPQLATQAIVAAAWVWIASMGLPMVVRGLSLGAGHPLGGIVLWTLATHALALISVPVAAVALWRHSDWAYVLILPAAVNTLVYSVYLWWLVDFQIARMTDAVIAVPAVVAAATVLLILIVGVQRVRRPS